MLVPGAGRDITVVDHAIWRVAQLVAAVCFLALLAGVAGMFLARRLFSERRLG